MRKTLLARDAMSAPLVTLHVNDTMDHAAALFLDNGISGAPVLDDGGRAVGVLSKTDIVRYEREHVAVDQPQDVREAMRTLDSLEVIAQSRGFHAVTPEDRVGQWMTPKVFAVDEDAPLAEVARRAAEWKMHRVFVRGKGRKLVGVITTFDLMKRLYERNAS